MIQFATTIKKFGEQGEKTGWTYIEIPADLAEQLNPGTRKGFRVRGKLDDYEFNLLSLVPMGNGNFILALNAAIRKAVKKQKNATIQVKIEVDKRELKPPAELLECLQDEPAALVQFQKITKGHQNYFINWINSAKTDATKAKRIATTVNGLTKGLSFGEMLRTEKNEKFI